MEMKDLVKKSVKDLYKLLDEKKALLRGFRFDISGSKIKNVNQGSTLKKEIARILVVIKDKKAEESKLVSA